MMKNISSFLVWGTLGAILQGTVFAENASSVNSSVQAEIQQIQGLLSTNPTNGSLYIRLAKNYFSLGDYSAAEKALLNAKNMRYSEREWMIPLGEVYLKKHQYRALLETLSLGNNWIPEDAFAQSVLLLRAHAYFYLEEPKEAQRLYEDILNINAECAGCWYGLARIAFEDNKLELAKKRMRSAIQYGYVEDPYLLPKIETMLFKETGSSLAAYQMYSKLLKNEKTKFEGLLGLTYMMLLDENEEEFYLQSNALYKYNPNNPEAVFLRGFSEYRRGNFEEAKELFTKVVSLDRDHLISRYFLLKMVSQSGNLLKTREIVEEIYQLQPNSNMVAPLLTILDYKTGFYDRAHSSLQDLRSKDPNNFRWIALDGSFSLSEGKTDRALELYKKAANMSSKEDFEKISIGPKELMDNFYEKYKAYFSIPLDSFIYKEALYVLYDLKVMDYESSMGHANKFLASNPGAFAHYLRASVADAMDDRNDALYYYEQSLRAQPNFLSAINKIAQCYIKAGDYTIAEEKLAEYRDLAAGYDDPETYVQLAKNFDLQSKEKETIVWLKEAINKNPSNIEPALALIMFYYKYGYKEESFYLAKKTFEDRSDNISVNEVYANVALRTKHYSDALSAYQLLNKRTPNSVHVLLGMAECQIHTNQDVAALESVDHVFQIDKENMKALLLSAELAKRKKHYDTVIELAEKVLDRDQNSEEAYELIGSAYLSKGENKKALLIYEGAFANLHNLKMAKKLYVLRRMNGDTTAAIQGVEAFVTENPIDRSARYFLASCYEDTQDYLKAILSYERILLDNQNDIVALRHLARLYMRYDSRRAIDFADRAYRMDGKDVINIDTLGWALINGNNVQRGLALIQDAVQLAPDNMEIRYHLAVAKTKIGDIDGARRDLSVVLKTPTSPSLRDEVTAFSATLPRIVR